MQPKRRSRTRPAERVDERTDERAAEPAAEPRAPRGPAASRVRGADTRATKNAGTRAKEPVELGAAVLSAWRTHERIHHFLLAALPDAAWDAKPPSGSGRTIAAIVSHMHNVRHMWLVVAAKGVLEAREIPDKVERRTLTLVDARAALAASGLAIERLLAHALEHGGHVKEFKPDVVGMLSYMVAHEAHHRGQICMQARALGHPLPHEIGYGMWDWAKRWRETLPAP